VVITPFCRNKNRATPRRPYENKMRRTNPPEPKLFGLPRPLAGAVIGALLFLVILLPLKYLDYNSVSLYFLALNLELPGRITILILGMTARIDMPRSVANLLSITISTIPAGVLGTLIASSRKPARTRGIIFAVLYLVIILACGTLMTLAGI